MKGRFRVFKVGSLHHIYQRTVDGYLIFYSVRDFIVFFTLFCTLARKHRMNVLGLCLMIDHIHVLLSAPSRVELSAFVRDYTSQFSKKRNAHYSRKGQFFEHRFGSAPKTSDKKARTAISYIYNNPVPLQEGRRLSMELPKVRTLPEPLFRTYALESRKSILKACGRYS